MTSLPDVPTTDEAGLPGFYTSIWFGLWAPKGTPKDVIAKLNAATVTALADPTVKERLAKLGQTVSSPDMQTPEALGKFQKAEADKWWPVIKDGKYQGRLKSQRVAGKKEQHRDVIAPFSLAARRLRRCFGVSLPRGIRGHLAVPHRQAGSRFPARRWIGLRRPYCRQPIVRHVGPDGRHREQARRRRPDCHGCHGPRRAGRLHSDCWRPARRGCSVFCSIR